LGGGGLGGGGGGGGWGVGGGGGGVVLKVNFGMVVPLECDKYHILIFSQDESHTHSYIQNIQSMKTIPIHILDKNPR
jgi:hypothetical protein